LLGDIFDQAVTMHMPTFNRLFVRLYTWQGQVIVIAGNHDQYDGAYSCLRTLHAGSCRVVLVPEFDRAYGALLPYQPLHEYRETIKGIDKSVRTVWTHIGVKGAYRNAMQKDRDGLGANEIPDRWVITGHYHLPQVAGRVIYTGSPFEHSFSEEGQRKGWLRWTEPDTMPTRIEFSDTGAPKHVTIGWDPSAGGVDSSIAFDRSRDKIRVRTLAPRSVAKQRIKQLADAGLTGVPVLAPADEGVGRGIVNEGASPREAVEQYVRSVYGSDLNLPTPSEMMEWATTWNLLAVV